MQEMRISRAVTPGCVPESAEIKRRQPGGQLSDGRKDAMDKDGYQYPAAENWIRGRQLRPGIRSAGVGRPCLRRLKSSGDTRFAPSLRHGDMGATGFNHTPPKTDKDGVWVTENVDIAPVLTHARLARANVELPLIELQSNTHEVL